MLSPRSRDIDDVSCQANEELHEQFISLDRIYDFDSLYIIMYAILLIRTSKFFLYIFLYNERGII